MLSNFAFKLIWRRFIKEDDAGGAPSKAKQKKLAREAASLSDGQLPCEVGSAVFLRHDPDRLDRMRAVITGPEVTRFNL